MTDEILYALGGGALIGAAVSLLMYCNGRIAGISDILCGLMQPSRADNAWRVPFFLGLLAGGMVLLLLYPDALSSGPVRTPVTLAVSGLLVGLGARLGSGCTSGHGVCGLARRSKRSLAATAVFMVSGMATVYLADHAFV